MEVKAGNQFRSSLFPAVPEVAEQLYRAWEVLLVMIVCESEIFLTLVLFTSDLKRGTKFVRTL